MAAKKKKAKAVKELRTANYTVTIGAPVVRAVALQTTVAATSRKDAEAQALEDFRNNGEDGFSEVEHDALESSYYREQDDPAHVLEVKLESASGGPVLECDECGEEFLPSDIKPVSEIKGILDMLEPGDRLPHGECPDCNGFVYDRSKGRE